MGARAKRPELKVEKRQVVGRKVKRLRREGILPANVYGKGVKSVAVQVGREEFGKIFKEVGETGLVEVKWNGESRPVLVHQVQVAPVSGEPLHVDFRQVDLKQKTTVMVPVNLSGEAPAEKQGGVVVQLLDEVEVAALPSDLPEEIVVDISGLMEIDAAIMVGDMEVDKKKVEVKTGADQVVVKVEPPTKEEVVEKEEAVGVEGEEKKGVAEEEKKVEAKREGEKKEAGVGEAKGGE